MCSRFFQFSKNHRLWVPSLNIPESKNCWVPSYFKKTFKEEEEEEELATFMKESEKKKGGGSLASSLTFSKNRVYIDRHQNRFLEWLEGVKRVCGHDDNRRVSVMATCHKTTSVSIN